MTPHTAPHDADRLFPADPAIRGLAGDLYQQIADRPIISPHGHVPAALLAADAPFTDPARLLVEGDHYITRLLHAAGVHLDQLHPRPDADPRETWRTLAAHWPMFAGTAAGYWLEQELAGVLGIHTELSAQTADNIYDAVMSHLGSDGFRPRALFQRFGIATLATTDDPLDDLRHHRALWGSELGKRILPTFRPDTLLDPDGPRFRTAVPRLTDLTGQPTTFAGYLAGLEARRHFFIEHGATSADHGVFEPLSAELDAAEAQTLFQRVLGGTADTGDRRLFRAHMLWQMARMSVQDGLVMTVHAGVLRNHHTATFDRYGPDTGHDIPVPTTFVQGLRPILQRFGLEPGFHLVLFTVDETTYSREIAPLAGFYPSVYIGAPWWFLDAPDAILRFRAAVTETAGFYRGSGFIDDTRAFLSIPARHDTARRLDSVFLARLVTEGRITRQRAERIADDLVDLIPRRAFKL